MDVTTAPAPPSPPVPRSRGRVVVMLVLLAAAGAAAAVVLLWPDSSSSARAFTPPKSIPTDCSRPVDADINRFLAGVPDNSTIRFKSGGCYAQDGSIEVIERQGLTIDGQGATFRAVTEGTMCRANWRVLAASNITLRNIIVRGINTTGFDGPRRADWCQHGFSLESVQGAQLLDSQSYDTAGDAVALGPDTRKGDYCVVPPNRSILIDRFHGFNSGRTVGLTHVDNVTIQNSYFADMFDNAIDVETDEDCESARNVRILNNRFGRYRFGLLSYTGAEEAGRGGGLEVVGNVVEADPATCSPAIYIKPPDGIVRDNFVIRNNTLRTLGDGVAIHQSRHARVEDNTFLKDYAGCGIDDRFAVRVTASSEVNVYGNKLIVGPRGGFGGELLADPTSANVTQSVPASLGPLPPLPAPVDEPPTLRIVSPENGATVSGEVTVRAEGSGKNLRRAEFFIDDVLVKTDVGPNYQHTWDTQGVEKGLHTVKVTLHNAAGLASTMSIAVTVG